MDRREGEVWVLRVRPTRTLWLGQMRTRCRSSEWWLRLHVEKGDADLDHLKAASSKEELRLEWDPEAPTSSQTAWCCREIAMAKATRTSRS